MATLRQQAQKRAKDWKKQTKMPNYYLAKHAKVSDSEFSRILSGNGYVSDAKCQQILDAKEPKL